MMGLRDVKVLTLFYAKEKVTPYKSMEFEETLSAYLENSKTPVSHSSIRRSITTLADSNLIKQGFKRNGKKTYYISSEGVKFLSEFAK